MPTVQVGPGSAQRLQEIADALGKSKKVVVVAGAGISTNCGIPDFRSENGLYSLIQAQYDEALKNPPWEQSNTFDIDDRPKKKRKQWYYEVVAPDGKVVDVIDPDVVMTTTEPESQPELEEGRSLRSRSSNATTTFNSRSSTPGDKCSDESSLSSAPSLLSGLLDLDSQDLPSDSNAANLFFPPQIDQGFVARRSLTPDSRSSRRKSPRSSSPLSELDSTITALQFKASSINNSRPSSRASSRSHQSSTVAVAPPFDIGTANSPPSSQDSTTSTRSSSLQRTDTNSGSSDADQEGLSNTQSSQGSRALPNIKGRDLFDSMVWSDPFTTSIFYMFIAILRQKVQQVAETSETHKFLRVLRDGGRLVRMYSQNIDQLEEREGLSTDLTLGPGNRNRFSYRSQKEPIPFVLDRHSTHFRGVEVVQLHGSLGHLRCGLCSRLSTWEDDEREILAQKGQAPDCPECALYNSRRTSNNRRGLSVGRLRPNIVLYGEEHPQTALIGPLVTHDIGLGPDVLLIMGTSLRVHGLKVIVKEFAKTVHGRGGKVVFVNQTKPSESTWGDLIDYWVEWDCDEWVLDLKKRSGDLWLPQGTTKEEEKKREPVTTTKPSQKRARPQCERDCKLNAVYVTLKILDNLRSIKDNEGQPSSRKENWPPLYWKSSNQSQQEKAPTKPQQSKRQPLKPQPLTRPSKLKAPVKSKPNSLKRKPQTHPTYSKPYLDDKENPAQKVAIMWEDMRKRNPLLPAAPPYLQRPFSALAGNMPEYSSGFQRSFYDFADVGGKSTASTLSFMNLTSLPPSGGPISGLSPAKQAQRPPAPIPVATPRTPPRHSYATRAKRNSTLPDAMESQTSSLSEVSDVIEVVDPADRPSTPDSQRIKRTTSIANIVSSPEEDVWHDASEVLLMS